MYYVQNTYKVIYGSLQTELMETKHNARIGIEHIFLATLLFTHINP